MNENAKKTIAEPARSIPVREEADVLVVGAGPSGITAALAAAEGGLKVALVEALPFVGGNLTLGLPLLGFLNAKGVQVVRGLAQTLIDRLAAVGAAGTHQSCPLHVSLTLIDPEAVKSVALEMLLERKVSVTLHALCAGVVQNGKDVAGVIIEGKSGREAILAKVVIDCTGDGDVAFRAGIDCPKGNEQGLMQPPTLLFRLAGVDVEKLRLSVAKDADQYDVDYIPNEYFGRNKKFIIVGLRKLMKKARAEGVNLPTDRSILITGLRENEIWVNMTRVKGVDSTDTSSLTNGEVEARRQVGEIFRYLRDYVPGFQDSRLAQTAPYLGIRESRRTVGRYVMTREDILGCRKFDDGVAVGSYPVDLHRPDDDDCTLEWCGDSYDIPYRSLLPLGAGNLLVAGRCISATHEAMAATRVMPTCMAIGEAAGRAAKQAVLKGIPPEKVDVAELRKELKDRGAYLRD